MVLKLRPLVTVAGVSQMFGAQDVRVVKARTLGGDVLTNKLCGIKPGQILINKKPTGEGWY